MSREKFRDDLAGEIFLPKIDPEDNRYFLFNKKVTFKMYFSGKKKPLELMQKVFSSQTSFVPDYIKFLGMKNVLLLGYGKEGKVTEKYLNKNFPGLEVGVGDITIDPDYLEKQKNYDIAVRSPGVRKELVKIPYTTATNIFFSYVKQIPGVKIIGVTGSKGKSTTSALIHHILKKAGKKVEFLGNIGNPMLEFLLDKNIEKDTTFVLELSSYQLDDIKFSPDIAVITNIFPEHIDYHYNIKNYYSAKKNIIKYQGKDDVFVFNQKNKKIASWAKSAKSKTIPFAKEIPIDDSEIKILGKHNRDNIKAAIAVAQALDVGQGIIKSAIKSFNGLPHRLEFVGQYSGIKFYDDAISTAPESTIEAIKSLPKIGTIFLGGQDRGYSFSKLEKIIKKKKIKNIVLFPESGKRIFKKGRKGLNILETSSMEEAVKFAYKCTEAGQICLLSCASPSYSLWKNFEEKGDQFQSFVKNLGK
jgi:UDP-N-acetylmuramoylalanine--D-glutamate ligase